MSQVVLHRSGTDPDFGYSKRLDVDFTQLIGNFGATSYFKCHYGPTLCYQNANICCIISRIFSIHRLLYATFMRRLLKLKK